MWFKKKVEQKIEPRYQWKYTSIAIDLANLESLNEALSNGYMVNYNNGLMCGISVLPREGLIILSKTEQILIEG